MPAERSLRATAKRGNVPRLSTDEPTVYLNEFSDGLTPHDLSDSDELRSLLDSAADLSIEAPQAVRYRSHNTVLRSQRFHYLEWGDPASPPLILLHGSNQSAHSWDLVSLHLSRDWHVFALDQRGHGDSEWSRTADYSVHEMAEDLAAFIDVIGVADPVVIGHSMGGMVTLTFTRNHPEVPRAIGVVDIGPEVNAEGTKMIREFVGRNIEFDDMDEFLDRVEKYDRYRTRAHIAKTLKYNLLRRADGKYVTKNDRRRFHAEGEARRTPALTELAQLALPVLIVRGGDSNVLVQDAAERFVAALQQGRLVTIPDCGHNVASQNTAGVLDAVKGYLGSLE